MTMIPQNVVEQIQAASDIVDVVSSYIPIKRAGRSFKACCPFHNEKTPSFFVNPEKQIWHCFGCGAGGSVFNFVMQYERVSFPEAARALAAKAGIAVPERGGRREQEGESKDALYRLNDFAAAWFRKQLTATAPGTAVLEYLRKRGMSDDLIEHFWLGFAPESRDALFKAARGKGHRGEALLSLGLAMRREESAAVTDRFHNRLMIPIRDVSGRVIAFSGRVLGEGSPKYMNSPESVLFSKSRSLYGIHEARRAIVERGAAIVVEGYFDLFALYAAGIRNVVASQGTAFTADHARSLKRYAPEAVMSFDADAAGQSAALRSLDALVHEGLRVRVLVLAAGHDPDSFVREKGKEAFLALVEHAPDYFDFLLDGLCRRRDARTEVGKARVASEFLDALAQVKDEILREAYRKKLSERIDIPQEYIIREMAKKGRRQPAARREEGDEPQAAGPLPAVEKEIVKLMLEDERVIKQACADLAPDEFRDERLQRIVGTAFTLYRENRWGGCSRLLACLADDRCARILSGLMAEEGPGGDREAIVRDCIKHLKRRNLREEISTIAREISRREKEGSPAREIQQLQQQLMEKKNAMLRIG
jgi:DNA primase